MPSVLKAREEEKSWVVSLLATSSESMPAASAYVQNIINGRKRRSRTLDTDDVAVARQNLV